MLILNFIKTGLSQNTEEGGGGCKCARKLGIWMQIQWEFKFKCKFSGNLNANSLEFKCKFSGNLNFKCKFSENLNLNADSVGIYICLENLDATSVGI